MIFFNPLKCHKFKSTESSTQNIEAAHLELEVVVFDEVLDRLVAGHLGDGCPADGRPPHVHDS